MRKTLKKIWHFLWHEDDIATWKGFLSLIINLFLAFIIIKFLFYPGLGLVFQTDYPIVAVLSESMDHNQINPCLPGQYNIFGECVIRDNSKFELCGKQTNTWLYIDYEAYWQNCGSWYEEKEITKEQFDSFPLSQGFSKGDMLFIYGSKPENIEPGDIIVFESSKRYPIIHRVVQKFEEGGKTYYQTKGDHNKDSINEPYLNELKVAHDDKTFKGKAILWLPYLGYVKIIPTNIYKMFTGA